MEGMVGTERGGISVRLIDADRLKRQVEGRSWRAKGKMVELIDNSPTVEPVKHGRWECESDMETYTIWRCSECGIGFENTSAYCRNCGARMDAEIEVIRKAADDD